MSVVSPDTAHQSRDFSSHQRPVCHLIISHQTNHIDINSRLERSFTYHPHILSVIQWSGRFWQIKSFCSFLNKNWPKTSLRNGFKIVDFHWVSVGSITSRPRPQTLPLSALISLTVRHGPRLETEICPDRGQVSKYLRISSVDTTLTGNGWEVVMIHSRKWKVWHCLYSVVVTADGWRYVWRLNRILSAHLISPTGRYQSTFRPPPELTYNSESYHHTFHENLRSEEFILSFNNSISISIAHLRDLRFISCSICHSA